MKPQLKILSFSLLLFVLTGCGDKNSPPAPQTQVHDRRTSDRATARIWEDISFEVTNPGNVTQATSMTGMRGSTPEETDAQWEITMAEDVKIRFEKRPENSATFTMNGEKYGTLAAGDSVVIDAERNVQVNGALRESVTNKP